MRRKISCKNTHTPNIRTPSPNCQFSITKYHFRSYFLGTPERHPGQQHLYRVSSLPPKFGIALSNPQCLTCSKAIAEHAATTTGTPPRLATAWDDDWEADPTQPPPTSTATPKKKRKKEITPKPQTQPCQYHRATFAPSQSGFVVVECLGPVIPTSSIYRISYTATEKALQLVFHVQNNTRLKERIAAVALPQVRTFPVMISGGYHAQVRLYLPPGLREDEITRYPLILHV